MNIYRKHPHTDAYALNDDNVYTPYAYLATNKRFTDAELVAEYWAAHGEANALMTGNPRLPFSRRQTLRRFATLPHFDSGETA